MSARAFSAALRSWLLAPALVGALVVGVTAAPPLAPAVAAADDLATDWTSYVDPFVSTEDDFGQDLPGAQAPHGLAKVNPLTMSGRSHTGYDYAQTSIAGFTHTNLDGVGGSGAGGDILVVPTDTTYTVRPATSTYAKAFSHDTEQARPGYYSVDLADGTDGDLITAEATAAVRTGIDRFTFPNTGTSSIVVDLQNNFTSRVDSDLTVTTLDDGRVALSGQVTGSFNGYTYRLYYYSTTTQPVASVQTWGSDGTLSARTTRSGTDTGAILNFDVTAGDTVELRTTLSPISATQAQRDQAAEVGGLTFDDVRAATHADWNEQLGRVAVTDSTAADPDGSLIRLFYTHLYRMLSATVDATSTDGTWRGVDGVIYHADGYTHYDGWGTWDDFRKYSVYAYLYPEVFGDLAQSLVDLYVTAERGGKGAISDYVQSAPTVRYERSAVVIADAISKGYALDGLDEAWPMLVATENTYSSSEEALGYQPNDPGTTVGTSYDDWAMSVIATELGDTTHAAYYLARSGNYANTFQPGAWTASDDSAVSVLGSRNSDGSYASANLEQFQAASLYQGTLWQYNWYPAQDMAGLIDTMGGTTAAQDALSNFFGEQDLDDGSLMLHSNANEIDLQSPYLFNYVGEPAKTQYWVRNIYTKETWNRYIATDSTGEMPSSGGQLTPPVKTSVYSLDPQGFLPTMDNDTSTMSTMFVAAAVGLFPVTAGSDQYQIGTPFFPEVTIHHADGTDFRVTADGVTPDDYYVQSASLDGTAYDNTWIDYADLAGDGQLAFSMGDTASDWGSDSEPAFSMSTDAVEPAAATVTSSATSVAASATGTVDGTLTLTLSDGATFAGATGDDFVSGGLATVTGLPVGVTATVTRTSAQTLAVHVVGTLATIEQVRFAVELTDDALVGVAASAVTGTGLTTRDPFRITIASALRSGLTDALSEARLIVRGNYTTGTFADVVAARLSARAVLANADATSRQLDAASGALQAAIDALSLSEGGLRVLQAEQSDDWSGGTLNNQAYMSNGNLGGVHAGSWVAYDGMDFSDGTPTAVQVRYSNPDGVGFDNSSVEVHANTVDGPLLTTVALTHNGSSWGSYSTAVGELAAGADLRGIERVYFVFRGTTPTTSEWVSNLDWFQFVTDPAAAPDFVELTPATASTIDSGLDISNATMFQNTNNGESATWTGYDFGSGASTLSVYYDKPSGRTTASADLAFYLDGGASPAITVPLAFTGSGWGTYATTTVAVDPVVFSGTHTVKVVFRAPDATSGNPYVGNIGAMTFAPAEAAEDVHVEFESYDPSTSVVNSGFKSENSTWGDGTTVTNVGGTLDGDLLAYPDLDFGSQTVTTVRVHYVNNSSRVGLNSRIEIMLDDPASTPVDTVSLPVTGSAWTNAGTLSVALPTAITGAHDVYLRLRTDAWDSHPYVSNLDWIEFAYGVDTTALTAAIDEYSPLADEESRFVTADATVFTAALRSARAVLADETTTTAEVAAATRALRLAASQLDPRSRRMVMVSIDDAAAIDTRRFTPESILSMQSAVDAGQELLDSTTEVSDEDLAAAAARIDQAIAELVVLVPTVPGSPVTVSATTDARTVTVTWAAPEDDGNSDLTGYVVELEGLAPVTITSAATTSYTFSDLTRGARVRARVSAVNAIGTSLPSEYTPFLLVAAIAPTAPNAPAASVVDSTVTVTWAAPEDGGSPITGYLVSLDGGAPVTVSADARSYAFTAVAPGMHSATVVAVNATGASAASIASNVVEVLPIATAPVVQIAGVTDTSVTVVWGAVVGATGYRVELRRGDVVLASADLSATTTSHTVSGLTAATDYTVTVAASTVRNTATSAAVPFTTAASADSPVVASHPVTIGGTAKAGAKLKAKAQAGKWSKGTVISYTWKVGGKKVGTKRTLVIKKAYRGKKVTLIVTGQKAGWTTATRTTTVRVRG